MMENDQPILAPRRRPRLGFLGVGWIGYKRLEAVIMEKAAEVVAIADCDRKKAVEAQKLAPRSQVCENINDILSIPLDGVVIATPNALHSEQAIAALQNGNAVFCQKPLARTALDTRCILDTAAACNRLIGVDFSYRYLLAVQKIGQILKNGTCGRIFAAEFTFHNAYGPDKPWFYDQSLSGGGCLLDLGVHLIDLSLWLLNYPKILEVKGRLYAKGKVLEAPVTQLEDFATIQLVLDGGTTVQIACSWNLNAGCDAVISGRLYGTEGGLEFRNVNGSFTEFSADFYKRTKRESLAEPPDPWQGRAVLAWVDQLSQSNKFDPQSCSFLTVARVLDQIYGR